MFKSCFVGMAKGEVDTANFLQVVHSNSIAFASDERKVYFAAASQHNEEDGDSNIANSCFLAIFSAAMGKNSGNAELSSPIEGIMEVVTLTRGIYVVMNAGRPFL